MIFVTSAHARPDVRNFLTSGNVCVQSPSFPDHVTKKRRALGTRMGLKEKHVETRMRVRGLGQGLKLAITYFSQHSWSYML